MRSNAINSILTGILAVSLVLSVIFCIQFIFQTREWRTLSGQVNSINVYRNGIQMLAADCLQYSEKNPAIDPILQSVNLKPAKAAPAATTKPAAK